MAESTPTTYSLAEAFNALPEAIKTWLASDRCTTLVSEINKKLGIKEERRKIIPTLVLRLVTRDLDPQDFISELGEELKINQQTAKSLAEEIEVKIIQPIETGLKRDVGVDIKLMFFGETPTSPSLGRPTAPSPEKPLPSSATPPASPSLGGPTPASPGKPTPPSPPPSPTPASPKPSLGGPEKEEGKPETNPFLIYKERSLRPASPPAPPYQGESLGGPTAPPVLRSMPAHLPGQEPRLDQPEPGQPVPDRTSPPQTKPTPPSPAGAGFGGQSPPAREGGLQSPPQAKPTPPNPPEIRPTAAQTIQIPVRSGTDNNDAAAPPDQTGPESVSVQFLTRQAPNNQETEYPQNSARIVHYSNLVTPLNDLGLEENPELDSFVVDLRSA